LLRATFSNIEQQALEYVGDCLTPWLVRWEQEGKRKAFSRGVDSALHLKHNVTALLRADAAARQSYYSSMVQNGVYSVNDVRQLEDMNGIGAEGDKHYHQSNMIELGKEPAVAKAMADRPEPPAIDGEPTDDAAESTDDDRVAAMVAGYRGALVDAYGRVLRVEADKATRAQRRGELAEWAGQFYPEHGAHVRGVLGPILTALAGSVAAVRGMPVYLADTAAELAARHVKHSRQVIAGASEDAEAIHQWATERAASAADDAIEELTRQLTKEPAHAC